MSSPRHEHDNNGGVLSSPRHEHGNNGGVLSYPRHVLAVNGGVEKVSTPAFKCAHLVLVCPVSLFATFTKDACP
jgi:hypothetical protein